MANKAISELPQALNVNNQDLFVLEQSGIAKKLPAETFITEQGIIDALAEALDGHGGIQSVTLSSVSGRIRTYRITFTDQSATTFQVYDGTSIDRISRTSSSGLDDVYTIFLSDGTTTFFTVHNGADGTVSEAMLNDALKDKAPAITETTESSAIANFTDGADDMVMHHVVAEINPVQDLTYGDPYPAGGGVNQWDEEWEVGALDSSTGSPISSTTTIRSKNFCPCVGDASYYVKCANYTDIYTLCVYWYDADKTLISRLWTCAKTATAPTNARYFKIATNTSGTVYGTTYNHDISINYPATVTAYSPYSNICPITGWTGCNMTRTGKNLLDTNAFVQGTIDADSGNEMISSTRVRSPFIWLPAGSYTVSSTNNFQIVFDVYDENKQFIRSESETNWKSAPHTYSLTNNRFVRILFKKANDTGISPAELTGEMMELGSTATAYEPYQAETVSVDWTTEAGTVYGGTIDVATGLLTVTWAMITIDGSTSLQVNGATANISKFGVFVTGKANGRTNILSNLFAYPVGVTDTVGAVIGRDGNNFVEFSLPHDVAQTKAAGQAWFADNPTQLCYELATPQTYQLTGQQLKTLLGTNNVWTDISGNVTVKYPADTKMFIEKLTIPTEDDMVANQAITSGQYFMIGNSLYLALTNIASGAQITIGTNAQRVSLADALNTINS